MTKFSNKLKKACFWPIFPILGVKKILLENPALLYTTSHGILAPCQISEKNNDTIPRKCLDRRTDGNADRPYSKNLKFATSNCRLFHPPLQLTILGNLVVTFLFGIRFTRRSFPSLRKTANSFGF